MKIVEFLPELVGIIGTVGGIYLKDYLERRRAEKHKSDLNDETIDDLIKPILDQIQFEMNAARVCYWEGINGTNTLSGFSIKKLSVMSESYSEEFHSIKDELQLVPVESFKRNIKELRESVDDYYISHEFEKNDSLSVLHNRYGKKTVLLVKVYRKKKWVGVLSAGFIEEPRMFEKEEIQWLLLQAGRIGTVIDTNIKG
jgi:hypothetical protein